MDISKVVFPLYKLRAYLNIETNPLGLVKITSVKGTYILDDTSINLPFEERRVKLVAEYPTEKIYKLKERILYLRQLVKYKTGTTFIDHNGTIIRYTKSSKLFNITSHKILHKRDYGTWTILTISGIETPFLLGERVKYTTKFASIMNTSWGPFLYDITSEIHEPYKRKI
jgi:hypothetical protein